MIETDFEKRERTSEVFLETVVDALDAARVALADTSSYAACETKLTSQCRRLFSALPLSKESRRCEKVQAAATRALTQQLELLGKQDIETNWSIYREFLELVSVHNSSDCKSARGDDALLSFELTADRPSADEVESMSEEERLHLSRTRGDLRVAMLIHDVDAVLALVESEIVQIARQRAMIANVENRSLPAMMAPRVVEPLFDVETEKSCGGKLGSVERRARSQLARLAFVPVSRRESPRCAITAAHIRMSDARPQCEPAAALLPTPKQDLLPLLEWKSLSTEALESIAALVRDDAVHCGDMQAYAALYHDELVLELRHRYASHGCRSGPTMYDSAEPLETVMAQWRSAAEAQYEFDDDTRLKLALIDASARQLNNIDCNYTFATHRKAGLVLRVLQWATQLVYLASCAGTLCVQTNLAHNSESVHWSAVKHALSTLAVELNTQLGVLSYERFLRALAIEIRLTYAGRLSVQVAAYARLACMLRELFDDANHDLKRTAMTAYGTLALRALATVVPDLDEQRQSFYLTLIRAIEASLRSLSLFSSRAAGLMMMGATLARCAGAGGINSLVYADSLHASFDVAMQRAFDIALPLVANQTLLLSEYFDKERGRIDAAE